MEFLQSVTAELVRIWQVSPTFYVALATAVVAWFSYRHTRKHNVSKNTLDFQTHWNDAARVDEAWKTISNMCKEIEGVLTFEQAAETANMHSKEAMDVKEILNRMECVAAAVEKKLYDEDMLRKNYCGMWLNMWKFVYKDFVVKRRTITDNPRIYIQLEKMLTQWQDAREKEDKTLIKKGWKSRF